MKARKIPRRIALLKLRTKDKEGRPIFITKYDQRHSPVQSIQLKHWRSMVKQNQYIAEVFKEPSLTAYRRQSNLRDILIKSKVPPAPPLRPKRNLVGMAKCDQNCTACHFVKKGNSAKINTK